LPLFRSAKPIEASFRPEAEIVYFLAMLLISLRKFRITQSLSS